jgi:hypothetical protein
MGEIADGLINGDFDYITGEYLGEGYGIPRTYEETRREQNKIYWNSLSKEEKEVRNLYTRLRGRQRAVVRMREIGKFIHKECNITLLPKSSEQYKLVYNNLDKFKEFLNS